MADNKPAISSEPLSDLNERTSGTPSVFQGEILFEEFSFEIGAITPMQSEAVRKCLSREAEKSGVDVPFTGGDSGGDTGLNHACELQNTDYGPES